MLQKWYSRRKVPKESLPSSIASATVDSRPSRPGLFEELREEVLTSGVASESHALPLGVHSRGLEPPVSQTPRLPLQELAERKNEEMLPEPIEETPVPSKNPPAPPAKLRGRILAVEDAPDIQRLVRLFLTSAGLDVTLATNGRNAIETALEYAEAGRPFDVILMDMQMPVLDGYQATEGLRASGYAGTIVALTAHALAGERERCLAAGCDDFLVKPINRTTLLRAMRRYLQPRFPS
jgi:CheY-like chemotaxis protein